MSTSQRFAVRLSSDSLTHSHLVEERSFEEAAMVFVERWHPAAEDDGEVTVIVRDEACGREQCFRIDIEHGGAAPCD